MIFEQIEIEVGGGGGEGESKGKISSLIIECISSIMSSFREKYMQDLSN